MAFKSLIKGLVPSPALRLIQRGKRAWKSRINRRRSVREVFSHIYEKGEWGANYSSGTGSTSLAIVGPYVSAISAYLGSLDSSVTVIVDLGCGDFQVGQHFVDRCAAYHAVDVVPELIDRHRRSNFGRHVAFYCMDVIEDELPDGNICFVRQVFQHLSNAQIQRILPKLKKYDFVFVTEHYPSRHTSAVPNLDKVHGADIRLYSKSGVYLDQPPFNLRTDAIELFLEVPSDPAPGNADAGVIRTFKINTRAAFNTA